MVVAHATLFIVPASTIAMNNTAIASGVHESCDKIEEGCAMQRARISKLEQEVKDLKAGQLANRLAVRVDIIASLQIRYHRN